MPISQLLGLLVGVVFSFFVSASTITLNGDKQPGSLIWAVADSDVLTVQLNGQAIPVHSDRRHFVFGFGRDAALNHTLDVKFSNGQHWQQNIVLQARSYQVERIEGVESKYVSPPDSVLKRIADEAQRVRAAREIVSERLDFIKPAKRPAKGRISGVYGSQRIFNGVPKRPHFGLDIAAPTGTPVYAPWDGVVVFADPDLYYSGGTLIIDHGLGVTSTYIHLSALHVELGDRIEQGKKIADIGATGRVTGAHLDWRLNWQSERLDPALLLKGD